MDIYIPSFIAVTFDDESAYQQFNDGFGASSEGVNQERFRATLKKFLGHEPDYWSADFNAFCSSPLTVREEEGSPEKTVSLAWVVINNPLCYTIKSADDFDVYLRPPSNVPDNAMVVLPPKETKNIEGLVETIGEQCPGLKVQSHGNMPFGRCPCY